MLFRSPQLSASIELVEVSAIEILCLYDLVYEVSNLIFRLLSAAGHHPCHESPDTHAFPWPGWRCTGEAWHGGSGPQHSWAMAGVLAEWLESS